MNPSKNMQYMTIHYAPGKFHCKISGENIIKIFNAIPSSAKSYPRLCRKTFGGKHRTATQNDINEFIKQANINPILILAYMANIPLPNKLDILCDVVNNTCSDSSKKARYC